MGFRDIIGKKDSDEEKPSGIVKQIKDLKNRIAKDENPESDSESKESVFEHLKGMVYTAKSEEEIQHEKEEKERKKLEKEEKSRIEREEKERARKEKEELAKANILTNEQLEQLIAESTIRKDDDVDTIFEKYVKLVLIFHKDTTQEQRKFLRTLQLQFINSIEPPENKREFLRLIRKSLIFTKDPTNDNIANAMVDIGSSVLKGVPVVGSIASCGGATDKLGDAVKAAIKSFQKECSEAWKSKINELKSTADIFFKDDELLLKQVKELTKDME